MLPELKVAVRVNYSGIVAQSSNMVCQTLALLFLFTPITVFAQLPNDYLKKVQHSLIIEDSYSANYYISLLQPLIVSHEEKMEVDFLKAEKSFLEGDYDGAEVFVKTVKQTRNSHELARSYLLEGKILNRKDRFKESLNALKRASELVKNNAKDPLFGELSHWLGMSWSAVGNYDEATENLNQALNFFQSDSLLYYIKLAQVHITRGLNYKRKRDYKKAEQEYHSALQILESTPIPKFKELSRAYINLANVYSEQSDYVATKLYYEKAIFINENNLHDTKQLAIIYSNIARFYQDNGNLLRSKQNYEKWYLLFDGGKRNSREEAMKMLLNYGAFLTDIFEYDYADKILLQSNGFLREEDATETQLLILFARARIKESLNQQDSVSILLLAAHALMKAKHVTDAKIWSQFNYRKGVMESNAGNYSQADSLYLSALQTERLQEEIDSDVLADICSSLAINYNLQKKYHESIFYFQEALRLTKSVMPLFSPQNIELLNDIGLQYLEQQQYDSATSYFTKAIQLNQLPHQESLEYSDSYEVLVSNSRLLLVALARNSAKELKKAEVYILTAYPIIETKRKSLKSFEDQVAYNREVRDFFDIAIEYYHRMLTLTDETDYFNKAFEMAEKARYQVLQHSLRDVRIGEFANVAQKVISENENTQKQISLLTKQIVEEMEYGEEANPDLLQEYKEGLVTLQTRHDQMIDSVKNNLPGFYNLKFSAATVSPSTLKKDLLKDDMALIQYHVGYEKVHVLIITKEKNYMVLLKDKTTLMKSIRGLSNINRLKLTNEFIPAAHQLYNQLIFPIDSVLRNSKKITRYIVIPDGEINYVPFDVLVIKPAAELSKCKFLLSDKMLSHGYSSTLLWQEFSDYAQELKKIRMLAYAPNFNAESASNLGTDLLRSATTKSKYATYDFPPLQMNATEVKSISSILNKSGFQNEMVLDIDADEASFKSKNLNQYEIIHLATHGFVDYPTANSSGIAFSFNQASREDGILFMDEIFSLRCHTHLVCLSACQTGFGQVDVGEGMMSMTRAFLYAGVKNLVVSLWAVQDNSTALLMEKFYKQFVKSKSISHSLRKAKLQMLQEAEFSHPYNWAGFIHVGMN